MRATFITLAIEEDGADPEILETRVTHTRKSRSASDGYNPRLHLGADLHRALEAGRRAATDVDRWIAWQLAHLGPVMSKVAFQRQQLATSRPRRRQGRRARGLTI